VLHHISKCTLIRWARLRLLLFAQTHFGFAIRNPPGLALHPRGVSTRCPSRPAGPADGPEVSASTASLLPLGRGTPSPTWTRYCGPRPFLGLPARLGSLPLDITAPLCAGPQTGGSERADELTPAPPPRGRGPLPLPLNLANTIHGSHSFQFLPGTPALECHPFSSSTFAHDPVVSPQEI
jgi:hypothetical protein